MRRTRSLTAAAMLLFALPATALAHAELVSSQPAASSVLETGPDEVAVTFDSELDPDASSLQVLAADGTVIGEGGVDLDVADRNVLRAPVSISRDGAYSVVWTAASIDGHVESGAFGFQVGTAPTSAVANTALPAPRPNPGVIGAFLLALSGAIVVMRSRVTDR
jgi:methionine-rich copper-binding protein CopC